MTKTHTGPKVLPTGQTQVWAMEEKERVSGFRHTNKETAYQSLMESSLVSKELFNMVCGEMLGYGISRMVFIYEPAPDFVIKIEMGCGFHANVAEWQTWESVKNTKHAKWFAPCAKISACGSIMIQQRVAMGHDYTKYPKKVPAYFQDLKYQNWGIMEGRFVCADYAKTDLIKMGLTPKMQTAAWWNGK